MEAVLHLLDPELGGPAVLADVAEIDGGTVSTEEGKFIEFKVFNGGRGHLSGTISLDADSAGISMPERPFEGGPETVKVYLTGRGMYPGSKQVAHIIVNSNGGRLVIPVWFEVVRPGWAILGRCAKTGAVAAACAALVRIILLSNTPGQPSGFIDWPNRARMEDYAGRDLYGPIAMLLLVLAAGTAYYLVEMYRRQSDDDWD
jgi:hypothetical protein